MKRTVENCSLIKTNRKFGRGTPDQTPQGCKGYYRRGSLHQTCKNCLLCEVNFKVTRKARKGVELNDKT